MSEARKIELEEEEDLQEVAVLDDASAEIVLRQLKQAEDQYERMSAWYKAQTQRLKDIRDRTRAWAEVCLRPYFDMVPTTGKKIRTYDMPGGTLKLSAQDPEYEVTDAEMVPWLKATAPEYVRIKEEAAWGEWKKDHKFTVTADGGIATEDGEIVPGVKATVRSDKFSIKCK